MRHRKKFNHLGRKKAHREAMLANMSCSLIMHKRINTTLAKAKALRMYIEPILSKAKNDTTHSRRLVFSKLKQKKAITELFREIAPKIANRPGGYTRILKTGFRHGDNAQMCLMELVDFNENMLKEKISTSKRKRSRRGRKKKKTEHTSNVNVQSTVEEIPAKEDKPETIEQKQESENNEKNKEAEEGKE